MFVNNPLCNRQAEARAMAFGGKKGEEDLLPVLLRYTASLIGHGDPYLVSGGPGHDRYGSPIIHGLYCVLD